MMPNIICAVCLKPVELVEWFDDYATDTRVIRAKCHGSTDEMRISPSDTMRFGRELKTATGVAFSDERKELLQC